MRNNAGRGEQWGRGEQCGAWGSGAPMQGGVDVMKSDRQHNLDSCKYHKHAKPLNPKSHTATRLRQ